MPAAVRRSVSPSFYRAIYRVVLLCCFMLTLAGLGIAGSPGDLRPLGPVVVNDSTVDQTGGVVARRPDGGFVVVWAGTGVEDPDGGIYLQEFNATGTAVHGQPLLVNRDAVRGVQRTPAVAWRAEHNNGHYVIVWESAADIVFTTYDGQVGTSTHATKDGRVQRLPAIAASQNWFVIVWQSLSEDGSGQGVFGKLYSTVSDAPQQFAVNTITANSQGNPAVAMDENGRFVVVWEGVNNDNLSQLTEIYGRSFSPAMALASDVSSLPQPENNDVQLNADTAGVQRRAAVAFSAGKVLVSWDGPAPGRSDLDVFARYFDFDLGPQGAAFTVPEPAAGGPAHQAESAVAMDRDGDALIVWREGNGEVRGRYRPASGPEIPLNRLDAGTAAAVLPAAALDADGDAVVVWTDTRASGGLLPSAIDPLRGELDLLLGVIDAPVLPGSVLFRRAVGPQPVDLAIERSGGPQSGPGSYSVTVKNSPSESEDSEGDDPIGIANGVHVSLPTAAVGQGTGWSCSGSQDLTVCNYSKPLPPHGTTDLQLHVREAEKPVLVAAEQFDPDTADNVAGARCLVRLVKATGDLEPRSTVVEFTQAADGTLVDGVARIPLERVGQSCEPIDVTVKTVQRTQNPDPGTAVTGQDFAGASLSFTWQPTDPANRTFDVVIKADAVDEDKEIFYVQLGEHEGPRHEVTIQDANDEPVVRLSAPALTYEDRPNLAVKALLLPAAGKRAGSSSRTIEVPLLLSGSAVPEVDYDQGPAHVVALEAGETEGTLALTVINDSSRESEERIDISMGDPSNARSDHLERSQPPPHASVRLIDDESAGPWVEFEAEADEMQEGQSRTVHVQLSRARDEDTFVFFTRSGSCEADCTVTPSPVVIPAGLTKTQITIAAEDDDVGEDTETVVLRLDDATWAAIREPATYTLSVKDNEPPAVNFERDASSVNEGTHPGTSRVAPVTITLTRPAEQTIRAQLTVGGTASPGPDHEAVGGEVVFSPGEDRKTLTVPIHQDALDEDDETIEFQITEVTNAVLGSRSKHVLTIVDDDDPPFVSFQLPLHKEEGSEGTVAVQVFLSDGSGNTFTSGKPVTVPFAVSGTATEGSDFSAPLPRQIVIPPGHSTGTYSFTILDDSIDEPNQTVVLTMDSERLVNARPLAPTSHTTTILDNDDPPSVQWRLASQDEPEGTASTGRTVSVEIELSRESEWQVEVTDSLSGTATPGEDHDAESATFVFEPGRRSHIYTFNIVQDAMDEDDETLVFQIQETGLTNARLGSPLTHVMTIRDDDDPPTVSFAQDGSIQEGSSGGTKQAGVTISLSRPSGKQVEVPFNLTGSATLADKDHNAVAGKFVFPPGMTSRTYVFLVTEDTRDEDDETIEFQMDVSALKNAIPGERTKHVLTIVDDDPLPVVRFDPSAAELVEGNSGAKTVTATAKLSPISGRDVTVHFTVGGTASKSSDHDAADGQIVIPAGQQSGTYTFNVKGDTVHEPDETVVLTMGTPTNATAGSAKTHTTTIKNDDIGTPPDAPKVRLSLSGSPFAENGGTATVTATLSRSHTQPVTVKLEYPTDATTATKGTDYRTSSDQITIPAGSTSRSMTLTGIDDSIDEADQYVFVGIASVTNGVEDGNQLVSARIRDDDAPPVVRFSTSGISVNEGYVEVTVTLKLSQKSELQVRVPLVLSGTATAGGVDHWSFSRTVKIQPGTTGKSFTFKVVEDSRDEPNETVVHSINVDGVDNATVGSPKVHTTTIVDDD